MSAPDTAAPLLVTSEPTLLDRVRELAAAVGIDVHAAVTPAAAGRRWVESVLVLLGDDVVPESLPGGRDGLVLLTRLADARAWRRAGEVGAGRVLVLPGGEEALAELLVAAGAGSARGRVVGVLGAVGGCGATTLAVALAAGRPPGGALLVDGDPVGSGIDVALGTEVEAGLRWRDLARVHGTMRPDVLASSLPALDGLPLLTWGVWGDEIDTAASEIEAGRVDLVPLEAMRSVVRAARAVADLTVVDLPRRLDVSAAQHWRLLDSAVLLVPAQVRAVVAARLALARLSAVVPDVRVVVRLPSRRGLGPDAVADVLDLPAVVTWKTVPRLASAADRGDLLHAVRSGGAGRSLRDLGDLLAGSGAGLAGVA